MVFKDQLSRSCCQTRKDIFSEVTQGLALGLGLFNISINNIDDEIKGVFIK